MPKPILYRSVTCSHRSGTYRITFHITSKAESFLLRVANLKSIFGILGYNDEELKKSVV
jgi:hypothetical protein